MVRDQDIAGVALASMPEASLAVKASRVFHREALADHSPEVAYPDLASRDTALAHVGPCTARGEE